MKATEWAFDRIKEAFEQVAQGENMIGSTDYLRRTIASVGGQGGVTMSYLCTHCNSFLLEDYIWWVSGRIEHTTWWYAICGEKHDWKQPNRLLVVQTIDGTDHAKVFKAHAVPQGLCENLINALKLLANQQEDGDGLLQNIVKDLGKESRKGLTDGSREFLKNDNERVLEVGYLDQGMGTFKVRTKAESSRRMPRGDCQGEPK